jgi:PAS domain-containing protein
LKVFENRVLRRIFGTKREEVAGGWKRLQNGEFHNFYASPNIIGVIKSRRTSLAGHVARTGNYIFVRNNGRKINGRGRSEDLGVDGRITDLRETSWKVADWIHLAQNKGQWPTLLSAVMNVGFQKRRGIF